MQGVGACFASCTRQATGPKTQNIGKHEPKIEKTIGKHEPKFKKRDKKQNENEK
jgi:hypothetical protein